jgi:hypothetical protein
MKTAWRVSLLLVFSLLLIWISTFGYAQTTVPSKAVGSGITGTVVDAVTREPLPLVTVSIFQKKGTQETLLGGVQSGVDGQFILPKIEKGDFWLRYSFVGYQSLEQLVHGSAAGGPPRRLNPVALQPQTQQLQEVQVQGHRADVTITPEKRIFNVASSLTSLGGTAEALLRNVPSVTIDESGVASLRNMPATIYVNGKPTQLTLAQIPANQIESVEVISNPSARYEAAATGGIVNIVLKQNRAPGYNGMVLVGIGNNSRYDATTNLDWQVGKWTLTALYSLNATRNPLKGYVNRVTYDPSSQSYDYFNQTTDINLNNRFQSGRLSAAYRPGTHDLVTLSGTLVTGAYNTNSNQQYSYRDGSGTVTGYGSRLTIPQNNFTNLQAELDWQHTFARKGEELRLMSSFTQNRISNAGDWLTTSFVTDSTNRLVPRPVTRSPTGLTAPLPVARHWCSWITFAR